MENDMGRSNAGKKMFSGAELGMQRVVRYPRCGARIKFNGILLIIGEVSNGTTI